MQVSNVLSGVLSRRIPATAALKAIIKMMALWRGYLIKRNDVADRWGYTALQADASVRAAG